MLIYITMYNIKFTIIGSAYNLKLYIGWILLDRMNIIIMCV